MHVILLFLVLSFPLAFVYIYIFVSLFSDTTTIVSE